MRTEFKVPERSWISNSPEDSVLNKKRTTWISNWRGKNRLKQRINNPTSKDVEGNEVTDSELDPSDFSVSSEKLVLTDKYDLPPNRWSDSKKKVIDRIVNNGEIHDTHSTAGVGCLMYHVLLFFSYPDDDMWKPIEHLPSQKLLSSYCRRRLSPPTYIYK